MVASGSPPTINTFPPGSGIAVLNLRAVVISLILTNVPAVSTTPGNANVKRATTVSVVLCIMVVLHKCAV